MASCVTAIVVYLRPAGTRGRASASEGGDLVLPFVVRNREGIRRLVDPGPFAASSQPRLFRRVRRALREVLFAFVLVVMGHGDGIPDLERDESRGRAVGAPERPWLDPSAVATAATCVASGPFPPSRSSIIWLRRGLARRRNGSAAGRRALTATADECTEISSSPDQETQLQQRGDCAVLSKPRQLRSVLVI